MVKTLLKVNMPVNFNKEINLEKDLEKLVNAAYNYTSKCNCKKSIHLLSVEKNSLIFII